MLVAVALTGCEHFAAPEPVRDASGPIPAGLGRLRLVNESGITIYEVWLTACLGGSPEKLRRRLETGDALIRDVPAGCVRVTLYPERSAFFFTVVVPEGEVTTRAF